MGAEDSSSEHRDRGRHSRGEPGHHHLVGQPHREREEGPISEAEATASEISSPRRPLGELGTPLNRRTPFLVGLFGAAGVGVTYVLAQGVVEARHMLLLIGLALFIAVGLEPAVSWLAARRLPRWAAVTAVLLALVGLVGGFLAVAIPVVVDQARSLGHWLPGTLRGLWDPGSWLGRLVERFHLDQEVQRLLGNQSHTLVEGALGVGRAVFGAVGDTLVAAVLVIYFLADLPRIRQGLYRLVPHSRRPRAILLGDEIFAKVGGYMLGNLAISLIAGTAALVWLMIFDVPYALLLAIAFALLDLIPVVGSTLGAVIVCLVAFTVSVPVGLATIGFMIAYRVAEDYLLVPRIIGRVVDVPALVTIVAVLLGGALLGVVGALVAIPVAAAILLVLREVTFPRLDRS
ncbi:AI-2E family transporter [Allokutzneria oryzae]|uniref:AI-2E family transporter n=1 Tax=Allokutzneria oryzae TaxID=1378989 RepID=A0ABV6A748_9PSEU